MPETTFKLITLVLQFDDSGKTKNINKLPPGETIQMPPLSEKIHIDIVPKAPKS